MNQIKGLFLKRKFNITIFLIMALLGVLTQIVAATALDLILNAIPGAADKYLQNISGMLEISARIIILVGFLSPILEEIVFRVIVFGVAGRFMPFIFANIIQAALFGIYHGNLIQGIYAFILGMFIGYLMYLAGGAVYTIAFHISINIAGLFLDKIIPPDIGMPVNILIALICAMVGGSLLAVLTKFNKKVETLF